MGLFSCVLFFFFVCVFFFIFVQTKWLATVSQTVFKWFYFFQGQLHKVLQPIPPINQCSLLGNHLSNLVSNKTVSFLVLIPCGLCLVPEKRGRPKQSPQSQGRSQEFEEMKMWALSWTNTAGRQNLTSAVRERAEFAVLRFHKNATV